MQKLKEMVLSGILSVALTPLAFLLMPFIAIGAIFGAIATWIRGMIGVKTT